RLLRFQSDNAGDNRARAVDSTQVKTVNRGIRLQSFVRLTLALRGCRGECDGGVIGGVGRVPGNGQAYSMFCRLTSRFLEDVRPLS
ncbi:MAG: hypothetical protein ACKOAH_07880, partial [Pirellula sp.]